MDRFKRGDRVKYRHPNSPVLIVVTDLGEAPLPDGHIDHVPVRQLYQCEWFDSAGVYREGKFRGDMLERLPDGG